MKPWLGDRRSPYGRAVMVFNMQSTVAGRLWEALAWRSPFAIWQGRRSWFSTSIYSRREALGGPGREIAVCHLAEPSEGGRGEEEGEGEPQQEIALESIVVYLESPSRRREQKSIVKLL